MRIFFGLLALGVLPPSVTASWAPECGHSASYKAVCSIRVESLARNFKEIESYRYAETFSSMSQQLQQSESSYNQDVKSGSFSMGGRYMKLFSFSASASYSQSETNAMASESYKSISMAASKKDVQHERKTSEVTYNANVPYQVYIEIDSTYTLDGQSFNAKRKNWMTSLQNQPSLEEKRNYIKAYCPSRLDIVAPDAFLTDKFLRKEDYHWTINTGSMNICLLKEAKGFNVNTKQELYNPAFADGSYYRDSYWNLQPKFAIDGQKVGYGGSAFAHSSGSPVFTANLKQACAVTEIIVYPRRDCCYDRYTNLKAYIDNNECSAESYFSESYVKDSFYDGLKFKCYASGTGTQVKVTAHGTYLQIGELEVYCKARVSKAKQPLYNPAFADGSWYYDGSWDLRPRYAVDGKVPSTAVDWSNDFAHSTSSSPVFTASLSKPCKVTEIIVYPRLGCCWDRYTTLKAYVNGYACQAVTYFSENYVKANVEYGLKFRCSTTGSQVKVTAHGTYLQIAELEAYCSV